MVADSGGVGGEAWTCDAQTNKINFIQCVCPSPWFLDGNRFRRKMTIDDEVTRPWPCRPMPGVVVAGFRDAGQIFPIHDQYLIKQ